MPEGIGISHTEVEVFLVQVPKELFNPEIHAFAHMYMLVACVVDNRSFANSRKGLRVMEGRLELDREVLHAPQVEPMRTVGPEFLQFRGIFLLLTFQGADSFGCGAKPERHNLTGTQAPRAPDGGGPSVRLLPLGPARGPRSCTTASILTYLCRYLRPILCTMLHKRSTAVS